VIRIDQSVCTGRQDCESLWVAVMIYATLVNTQTHSFLLVILLTQLSSWGRNVQSDCYQLHTILYGSVNEYQLWLGRQRQVWFIPFTDERGVCRWNCEIPWEHVPYLSALEVCSRQGTIPYLAQFQTAWSVIDILQHDSLLKQMDWLFTWLVNSFGRNCCHLSWLAVGNDHWLSNLLLCDWQVMYLDRIFNTGVWSVCRLSCSLMTRLKQEHLS